MTVRLGLGLAALGRPGYVTLNHASDLGGRYDPAAMEAHAHAVLDAAFCENGFGGCDFPWAAVITLGGIGAAAGAGIDFLIRRDSNARKVTLRLSPMIGGTRKGVLASVVLPERASLPARPTGRAGTLAGALMPGNRLPTTVSPANP